MSMPRVSKERQDARIRITKMKLEVIESVSNVPDLSRNEYIKALIELLNDAQNDTIIEESP